MRARGILGTALLGTGLAALTVFVPSAASAATAPKPSPTCKVPVFSVSPLSAAPGSKVTVSGVNFSGCPAQGNPAKPTPVLTIKVAVGTASSPNGTVLATTKTTATGTFSVQITVPPLSSGGVPKLALIAGGTDPATGLTYAGEAVLAYTTAAAPVKVPAGTGGHAATTSSATRDEQLALAGLGGLLLAGGTAGAARRRTRRG